MVDGLCRFDLLLLIEMFRVIDFGLFEWTSTQGIVDF
jgi:hypothetical protein